MRNKQELRVLSQIFSPPMFKKIVREDDCLHFQKHVAGYFNTASHETNFDIIKSLYTSLQKQYRCEYVYKNNLIIDIIKTHCLKSTSILNELKIGGSKADLVMLNGAVRVYEIKTELDGLDKLAKQIMDYQKFANEVHIVTDEKYAKKLEIDYEDTDIGIVALNARNKLIRIKEAQTNESSFDFETIFKVLRKQEYLDLVNENFGSVPDVPNTKIFRACYEALAALDIVEFQKQVFNKLKQRKLMNPRWLKSPKTPSALKHICNSLDFNEQDYKKLYNFLATKNVCISHI